MTLKQWLAATRMTQTALAQKTRIPQALLSKYVLGRQRPHIDNAVAIELATDGGVPVETWVGWKPSKKRSKRAA